MGKNKLKKFAEMETFDNVFQYPFAIVERDGFPLKGRWNKDFFKNDVFHAEDLSKIFKDKPDNFMNNYLSLLIFYPQHLTFWDLKLEKSMKR